MRKFFAIAFVSMVWPAQADEFIHFSDGTTAWRNSNGQVWGKTQPPPRPPQYGKHYRQHQTNPTAFGSDGTFYIPAGPNQMMDTRRGGFVPIR